MRELEKDDLIKYLSGKKYISDRRASVRHFIDKYIKSKNLSMALDLTLHFYAAGDLLPADLIKIEDFLLQMRNPNACFRFVMNAPTNRLSEHEDIVIEANDPVFCKMMSKLKGADSKKHSKVILSANSAKHSSEFLQMYPSVDKQEHISVIASVQDPFYMLETAKQYRGVGCKKLENALLNLKDPDYSLCYAKEINNADVLAHQTVVMFYGSVEQMLKFAKENETADMQFMISKLFDKFNKLCDMGKNDEAKELKPVLLELIEIKQICNENQKEQ